MLGLLSLSDVRGPMNTLEDALAGERGPEILEELKKFNRGEPCNLQKSPKEIQKVLLLMNANINIPAVTTPFVVADHFYINIGPNVVKEWKPGEVKIAGIGIAFQKFFGNQVIAKRDGHTLSSYKILQRAYDKAILKEVGIQTRTDLAGINALMALQPEGPHKKGALGVRNAFHIIDDTGTVRVVFLDWSDVGWGVGADGLGGYQWDAGSLVFARNSGN